MYTSIESSQDAQWAATIRPSVWTGGEPRISITSGRRIGDITMILSPRELRELQVVIEIALAQLPDPGAAIDVDDFAGYRVPEQS